MTTRLRSAALALVLAAAPAAAQSIFTNPITDTNPSSANPFVAGQTVDPNLTASGIGRGPGITANAGSNRYNAANWSTTGLDATDYFTWTLTPAAGYEIDLTGFTYTGQRSSTGPSTFAFRSSLDSFTADLGTPLAAGATIDLSGAGYQDVQGPIEFRLYGWAGTGASGTFSINDFTYNGSVVQFSPVPEPASLLVVAGLALGGFRLRKRIV